MFILVSILLTLLHFGLCTFGLFYFSVCTFKTSKLVHVLLTLIHFDPCTFKKISICIYFSMTLHLLNLFKHNHKLGLKVFIVCNIVYV